MQVFEKNIVPLNKVRFIGLEIRYYFIVARKTAYTRSDTMKGYYVADGYMGYVDGRYMLFASDSDYYEYMSR